MKINYMKSIITKLLAGMVLLTFAACNNDTEEEQKPGSTIVSPGAKAPGEPKKTEVTIGPDGSSIKTADGKELEVKKDGAKVGTRDVAIKVSTKDTTKQ
jgi:hypothetical protein